jgi:hypothetical protein
LRKSGKYRTYFCESEKEWERAVLKQKELEYENFAGKRAKRVVALAVLLLTADNITMVNKKSR